MSDAQTALKDCQKLAELGKVDRLSNALNKAIVAYPTRFEFFAMRAKLFIQARQFDQARQDLEKTVQLNPFHSESFDHLGVIEQMNGNFLRASELHLAALNSQPNNSGFLFNLGVALENLGQNTQAENLYESVLAIDPTHIKAMVNLAACYEKKNHNDKAITLFKQALSHDDKNFEAYMGLGNLYRKKRQKDQAIEHYQKAISLKPNHGSAQFMLANIRGDTPKNAPEDYVSALFDDFAETFEEKLTGELDYRAPDLLYQAIKKELEILKSNHQSLKSVDLGAGTGLFGILIRQDIDLSIGVDLSQKMLNKAQEKQIYDDIICSDLTKALMAQNDHSCHLISAVDVFVYVGALERVFSAVKKILHPEGVFAFTLESLDDTETDSFKLLDTARYAHSDSYIEQLAETYDFTIQSHDKACLRINKKAPINGAIYVLKQKSI